MLPRAVPLETDQALISAVLWEGSVTSLSLTGCFFCFVCFGVFFLANLVSNDETEPAGSRTLPHSYFRVFRDYLCWALGKQSKELAHS